MRSGSRTACSSPSAPTNPAGSSGSARSHSSTASLSCRSWWSPTACARAWTWREDQTIDFTGDFDVAVPDAARLPRLRAFARGRAGDAGPSVRRGATDTSRGWRRVRAVAAQGPRRRPGGAAAHDGRGRGRGRERRVRAADRRRGPHHGPVARLGGQQRRGGRRPPAAAAAPVHGLAPRGTGDEDARAGGAGRTALCGRLPGRRRIAARARTRCRDAGPPLRLVITVDPAAGFLRELPFEFLYRPGRHRSAGSFLATRSDLLFSRALEPDLALPARRSTDPPCGCCSRTRGDDQRTGIRDALGALADKSTIQLRLCGDSRLSDVLDLVDDWRPTVVHLVAAVRNGPDEVELATTVAERRRVDRPEPRRPTAHRPGARRPTHHRGGAAARRSGGGAPDRSCAEAGRAGRGGRARASPRRSNEGTATSSSVRSTTTWPAAMRSTSPSNGRAAI